MLARAVGLWLPIEKLGVDTVLLNQVIDAVLTFAVALVALARSTSSLPNKSRKMMAPSLGIVFYDSRVAAAR